jgi:hypothetical protein
VRRVEPRLDRGHGLVEFRFRLRGRQSADIIRFVVQRRNDLGVAAVISLTGYVPPYFA